MGAKSSFLNDLNRLLSISSDMAEAIDLNSMAELQCFVDKIDFSDPVFSGMVEDIHKSVSSDRISLITGAIEQRERRIFDEVVSKGDGTFIDGDRLIEEKLEKHLKTCQEEFQKEEFINDIQIGLYDDEERAANNHLPDIETAQFQFSNGLIGYVATRKGLRKPAINQEKELEDRFLFDTFEIEIGTVFHTFDIAAIFDGHGGTKAANFLKENFSEYLKKTILEHNLHAFTDRTLVNAYKMTFKNLEDAFYAQGSDLGSQLEPKSGSTATVLVTIDGKMTWALNVGDSFSCQCTETSILALTQDAIPEKDAYKKRIYKRFGHMRECGSCTRVVGKNGRPAVNLGAVFGDFHLKGRLPEHFFYTLPTKCVTTRPKITKVSTEKESLRYFLLSSDGVTEAYNKKTLNYFINYFLDDKDSFSLDRIPEYLINMAVEEGSKDDLTIMLIVNNI